MSTLTGIRGWWESWQLFPKMQPGVFSGQRRGRKIPLGSPGGLCFCICGLYYGLWRWCIFGDLLGMSREMESEFLSVLSYLLSVFYCASIVFMLLCLSYSVFCISCSGWFVSTCQVIGWKVSCDETSPVTSPGDCLHKVHVEECILFFCFCVFVANPKWYTWNIPSINELSDAWCKVK